MFCIKFGNFSAIISSDILSVSFSVSCSSESPIMCLLVYLKVSHRSLRLWSFLFAHFSVSHIEYQHFHVFWFSLLPVQICCWSSLVSRLWFFQWSCMDVRIGLWRKLSTEESMLLNCSVGEDSWESLGLQGDPTSPFWRRSALGFLWKEWCWTWNSSTLATSCEELTHWKRLWCWEGLGAGGEGGDRGWDGWMASLTQWIWVSVNSGSWWWTGRPGVLQFMGSQRVGHDWATDLIWCIVCNLMSLEISIYWWYCHHDLSCKHSHHLQKL